MSEGAWRVNKKEPRCRGYSKEMRAARRGRGCVQYLGSFSGANIENRVPIMRSASITTKEQNILTIPFCPMLIGWEGEGATVNISRLSF